MYHVGIHDVLLGVSVHGEGEDDAVFAAIVIDAVVIVVRVCVSVIVSVVNAAFIPSGGVGGAGEGRRR